MSTVVPLHPEPLFRRVVVVARDGAAHVFLAGPVQGRKYRPFRWIGALPTSDVWRIRNRVRSVAEHFALDLIEDRQGVIDPDRGPALYSLRGAA